MPKTAAPAFPLARLLVVAGAMFASVSSEFLPTGILPEIARDLDVSEAQVGLLVTVFAFTVAFTAAPLTTLTQRYSRKPLMIVLLGAFAITNIVCALAPTYWVLAAARVFGGLAHGLFWAVAGPYASRLVASAQVVRATAVTNSGGTLAFMLGVPIGAAIGHAFGWRWAFGIMAITIVVFALLVAAFLPPVEHRVSLRTGEIPIAIRRDPTLPFVILICVTILLAFAGQNTMNTFIAPWLLGVPQVDSAAIAPILFVAGVGGAIGLGIAGMLGNRDPHRLFTVLVSLLGLVGVALALVGAILPAALVTVFVWNIVSGAIPPLAHGMMMRDTSLRLRDTASAWLTVSFNAAIGGGALIGAGIVAWSGVAVLPWALSAFCAIAVVVLLIETARVRRGRARRAGDVPEPPRISLGG